MAEIITVQSSLIVVGHFIKHLSRNMAILCGYVTQSSGKCRHEPGHIDNNQAMHLHSSQTTAHCGRICKDRDKSFVGPKGEAKKLKEKALNDITNKLELRPSILKPERVVMRLGSSKQPKEDGTMFVQAQEGARECI